MDEVKRVVTQQEDKLVGLLELPHEAKEIHRLPIRAVLKSSLAQLSTYRASGHFKVIRSRTFESDPPDGQLES